MTDIREALSAAFEKTSGGEGGASAGGLDAGAGPGADDVQRADPGRESGREDGLEKNDGQGLGGSERGVDGGKAAGSRERDDSGRFKPKPKDTATSVAEAAKALKPATPVATPPPKEGAPAQTPAPVAGEPVATPAPQAKAPASWKPTAREHWAKLPAEVQAEIARVDKEVAESMRSGGEHRKVAEAYRATVAPFEAMIRSEGSEPMRAVGDLLNTAMALRTAPPAHKAQLVANIIQQFGIPVEALAKALDGQPAAPTQGQGHVDPAQIEQRILQRITGQVQQRQTAMATQQANQKVEKFVTNKEFIKDVSGIMAGIIETAAANGEELELEDAYDQACWARPDIRAILQQREAAKAATAAQAAHQKATAASVSVRSQPAGPSGPGPKGIRAQLEEAAARLEGGKR